MSAECQRTTVMNSDMCNISGSGSVYLSLSWCNQRARLIQIVSGTSHTQKRALANV